MEHKNVCAALALDKIDFHSNLMGKNPVAKFDESQVQLLDEALAKTVDTSALDKTINEQSQTIANHVTNETAISNAVKAAFTLNGLELPENTSDADAIATLSAKCKEYGKSTNTHSLIRTDGIDDDPDADPSANYAHNKALTDLSKFPKLK